MAHAWIYRCSSEPAAPSPCRCRTRNSACGSCISSKAAIHPVQIGPIHDVFTPNEAEVAWARRVLDAFCYSGGFGLHAARAGAREVIGVDTSEPALVLARENARRNGLDNIVFQRADVFDYLDQLGERLSQARSASAGEQRFGLVVLDPPKFARSWSR